MIYVLLADGFEEIEGLAFVDILRRGGIEVKTVSIKDTRMVTGAHDITVTADMLLTEVDEQAMTGVVLPGGMPGTMYLKESKAVAQLITHAYDAGKLIGAICAAPTILGAMGLLEGRNATCYPDCESELTGATICRERVVEDGSIVTSRGPGTTADFAAAFVRRLQGSQTAEAVLAAMQYQ